jgi:hypothetical protein
MRSAADSEDVGCPEPAAVLQRTASTRSCAARRRADLVNARGARQPPGRNSGPPDWAHGRN